MLSCDEEPAALLVFEDALRPEARETVERLNGLGLRTVLVSGDNEETATRIAAELGISEVHAEVLPEDKVRVVGALQEEGRRVAFVGDGVNDGPALATANVGGTMGLGGTDVAIETAESGSSPTISPSCRICSGCRSRRCARSARTSSSRWGPRGCGRAHRPPGYSPP